MSSTTTTGGFSFPSAGSNLSLGGLLQYPLPPSFPQLIYHRSGDFHIPLDLSLRPGPVPITPPSTPSPPRKKSKTSEGLDESVTPKKLSTASQFFDTVSVDNKKYFQNTVKSFSSEYLKIFSGASAYKSFEKIEENCAKVVQQDNESCSDNEIHIDESSSEDFIDITGPDDQEIFISSNKRFNENLSACEIANSDSMLTEDLTNLDKSEDSNDEIVDIETNESDNPMEFYEENSKAVLSSGQMRFEDPKQHSQAIEGFAKLFEKSFGKHHSEEKKISHEEKVTQHKTYKTERRRIKSRKQMVDEETTSPVSGTIIRKLRDGEELVVRKGDIDPCFNVVEVTEEAKASLGNFN